MRALAVIAARGGSKRIPRKNIRPFLGQPIIQYVIEAAAASQCFDSLIVSTEDTEIQAVSVAAGAEVPFLRSAKAADDHADLNDVLLEVLETYRAQGVFYDLVCLLLPTAPFITPKRIREGYQQLVERPDLDAVIPVSRLGPVQRALTIRDNRLTMLWPEYRDARSNDLEPAYQDCGQFYWLRTERFLAEKEIYMKNAGAILVPELETQDIDTEADWQMAELKYRLLHKASAMSVC
ncbi:MAG TPA: pseudaminic acid cytidylyltransferase, partial [Oculatellaceae cyanobacterium]|jgi:pseudaminic acid cytidylyltransferase